MKKALDKEKIEDALHLLGELLESRHIGPFNLIVCGGSALLVSGLRAEATKDVDILAYIGKKGEIIVADSIPEGLRKAAENVSVQMGLDSHWLNTGPSSIVNSKLPNLGLPDGFVSRLAEKTYSRMLKVFFIGRLDQIYFKLYASVDRGSPSYHLDDLIQLNPTQEELLAASRWSMEQDPSSGYSQTLKEMLKAINYGTVAEKL